MKRSLLVLCALCLCGCQGDAVPGSGLENRAAEKVVFQDVVQFHAALLDRALEDSKGIDLRRTRPPAQKFYRFGTDGPEQGTRQDLERAVEVDGPSLPLLPAGVYGIIFTGLSAVDEDGEVINTHLVRDDEQLATADVSLSFVVADPTSGWVQYSAPLRLDGPTGDWRRRGPPELVRRLRVPVESK